MSKGYFARGLAAKIWLYIVQYLHFRVLTFPLKCWYTVNFI